MNAAFFRRLRALPLEALVCLGGLDLGRLQRFLGLADGADRSLLRNTGDEPVALVVAAEELALVLAFTHQKEQMAVGGLNIENGDLGLGPRLADDLEELALAVGLHVQGEVARSAVAPSRAVGDLQASADAGKLDVEEIRVHEGKTPS